MNAINFVMLCVTGGYGLMMVCLQANNNNVVIIIIIEINERGIITINKNQDSI